MFFSGCGLLLLFGGTFHTHTHALAHALSNSSLEAHRQSQVRVVATARNPPKLAPGGTVRKTGKMPDFKGVGEKRVRERACVSSPTQTALRVVRFFLQQWRSSVLVSLPWFTAV